MSVSINEHIGRRLIAKRRSAGFTQRDIAEAVGISHQQIAKYECGDVAVSAERLWMIAEVLAVDMTYFFDGLEGQRAGDKARRIAPESH